MKLNEVINCVPSQQITMEPQGITWTNLNEMDMDN
jgi:hypothetical protein